MKGLSIKRTLNEDTRLSSVILHSGENGVYDLHFGEGDDQAFYVTEHGNPENILLVATKEIWNLTFES